MLNNKTVLITGSTGFVGAALARRCLNENGETHLITRAGSNRWRINDILNKAQEHNVDLLDFDKLVKVVSLIKPDIVFHLAAYGVYAFQNDARRIMEINYFGTANLLNACVKSDFELFVNTGSVFEYGLKQKPLAENMVLEPISDYGVAKAASTLYCHAIGKKKTKQLRH